MDYLDRVPQGDPEDSRDLFLEWTDALARIDTQPESIPDYLYKSVPVFATTFVTAPLHVTYLD